MPTGRKSRVSSPTATSKPSSAPSQAETLKSSERQRLLSILRRPENRGRFIRLIDQEIARQEGLLALQDAERDRVEAERRFIAEQGERTSFEEEKRKCADDFEYWADRWLWTYDPRLVGKPGGPFIQFIMWPKQRGFIKWLDERLAAAEQGAVPKSRDVGATYLCVAWALHKWLFVPGFQAGFGSNDKDAVDKRNNMNSIFQKLRLMLMRLPSWQMPDGFDWRRHDVDMLLTNPASGATIFGEAGDEMGRAGRCSIFFLDEAAKVQRINLVEAALLGVTDCVIYVSTVNRQGDFFDQKRLSNLQKRQVYQLHYRDDPRKSGDWAEKKKATLTDKTAFAREFEIDSSASTEDIFIPAAWVQAAQRLTKLVPKIKRGRKGIAGGDVGGGKASSSLVMRFGPVVLPVERRGDPDTTDTAYWMLNLCLKQGCGLLNFDNVGIGEGVKSTLSKATDEKYDVITRVPVNTGVPPTDRIWDDDSTSAEMFGNLKAELWWLARCAFERTYFHVLWLEKDPKGKEHALSDLIALPEDDLILAAQLSLPKRLRNDKGKITVEPKAALAKRGIPSPDDADAFVLTFLEDPNDAIPIVAPDSATFHRSNPARVGGRT